MTLTPETVIEQPPPERGFSLESGEHVDCSPAAYEISWQFCNQYRDLLVHNPSRVGLESVEAGGSINVISTSFRSSSESLVYEWIIHESSRTARLGEFSQRQQVYLHISEYKTLGLYERYDHQGLIRFSKILGGQATKEAGKLLQASFILAGIEPRAGELRRKKESIKVDLNKPGIKPKVKVGLEKRLKSTGFQPDSNDLFDRLAEATGV